MTIFKGMGRRTAEVNIMFSVGNEVPNTVFKFFSQKSPYRLNESRKTGFWGHIFSYICGSAGPIVSKNNRVHSWVDQHHVNFMKICLKLRPSSCVLIHVRINVVNYKYTIILTLQICNQEPPKRKTRPPPLTPF